MEEIKIITEQLKKLAKKGYHLDIVRDTIVLIDTNAFINETEKYEKSTNKNQPLKKGGKINGDIIDDDNYIIHVFK